MQRMLCRLYVCVCIALMTSLIFAQTPPEKDYGPCSTPSGKGHCMSVSECTGNGKPLPGYCPGPADIQVRKCVHVFVLVSVHVHKYAYAYYVYAYVPGYSKVYVLDCYWSF